MGIILHPRLYRWIWRNNKYSNIRATKIPSYLERDKYSCVTEFFKHPKALQTKNSSRVSTSFCLLRVFSFDYTYSFSWDKPYSYLYTRNLRLVWYHSSQERCKRKPRDLINHVKILIFLLSKDQNNSGAPSKLYLEVSLTKKVKDLELYHKSFKALETKLKKKFYHDWQIGLVKMATGQKKKRT